MKNIIIWLFSAMFLVILLTGCSNKNEVENLKKVNFNKSNIVKRGEIHSRGLFEKDGDSSYEIRLLENDMGYDIGTRLYYKIINNMETYNVYKERIEIPELNEKDFEKNFLLIVSNENVRKQDEIDLEIYDVIKSNNNMQIIMKQKENPDLNSQTNVFWAIVDNSVLKDKVNVIIEHINEIIEY